MTRAVLLDVDGTLLDFDACARESALLACRDVGEAFDADWMPVFRQVNQALWSQVERGELTVAEVYRLRWARIFAQLGLERDGPAFEARFLFHLGRSACPVPGATALLEGLKERGLTLCVASNAPYDQQVGRLERAGMLEFFDHLFLSERLGAAKPARAFFDGCLAALPGVGPEQVLMVGDSLAADIAGCRSAGIRGCWFNPRREAAGALRPDHTVYTLAEVLELL